MPLARNTARGTTAMRRNAALVVQGTIGDLVDFPLHVHLNHVVRSP